MNVTYNGPDDCPESLPLFPLAGALLLPRGQLPLNIFEPRYLAMLDDALKSHRLIGMIQPDVEDEAKAPQVPPLFQVGCAGRITQYSETGDGRVMITLTGVARFLVVNELPAVTPYRQAQVMFTPFIDDFTPRLGEDKVNRTRLLAALREFGQAHELKIEWKGVNAAPNEALVNALSMMCPFGPKEKQALLEAPDLGSRSEVLIALTEIDLARSGSSPDTMLQ